MASDQPRYGVAGRRPAIWRRGRSESKAIAAAHEALPRWKALTAYERCAILRDIADALRDRAEELAPIMTAECGKPLGEALGEWGACADLFDWFAEEGKRAYGRTIPARKAGKRLLSLPQPLGVVATITAWNFPLTCWRGSGPARWRPAALS